MFSSKRLGSGVVWVGGGCKCFPHPGRSGERKTGKGENFFLVITCLECGIRRQQMGRKIGLPISLATEPLVRG